MPFLNVLNSVVDPDPDRGPWVQMGSLDPNGVPVSGLGPWIRIRNPDPGGQK